MLFFATDGIPGMWQNYPILLGHQSNFRRVKWNDLEQIRYLFSHSVRYKLTKIKFLAGRYTYLKSHNAMKKLQTVYFQPQEGRAGTKLSRDITGFFGRGESQSLGLELLCLGCKGNSLFFCGMMWEVKVKSLLDQESVSFRMLRPQG